jgi:hypothetical protein
MVSVAVVEGAGKADRDLDEVAETVRALAVRR